jgi:hypothetical protein
MCPAKPHYLFLQDYIIVDHLTAAATSPSTNMCYSYRHHGSLLFCYEHTLTCGVDSCLGSFFFGLPPPPLLLQPWVLQKN